MSEHNKQPRARVAILDWPGLEEMEGVLDYLLDLMGGLERFVRPGQYVLIKPNVVAGALASTGGTTHVELVESLVRRVQRLRPGRLVVAEGPAVADPVRTFQFLGYLAMADRTGVELIDLDHAEHVPAPLADPIYPGVLEVARPILECDVLINVPCLKTHINAGITVAIKNAYGTVTQETRTRIHREYRVEEAICDLSRIRPPDLVVVDGLVGQQGVAGGADFTQPAGAKLMLAGDNVVAVDAIAARVMRQSTHIRSLSWAAERGLGPSDPSEIEIVGLTIEGAARAFLSPSEHLQRSMRGLELIDLNSCTGCRTIVDGAVRRYQGMELARPLRVVFGGEEREGQLDAPPPGGELLVVGNCARNLRHAGTFVPGCPPRADDLHAFLREANLACRRCHPVVQEVLSDLAADPLLADLRVLGGGEVIHQGANNTARPTDLALLVGNCMTNYYENSRLRADQVLGGQGDNVVFIPGCPPAVEDARAGVAQLRAVAARRPVPTG